MTDHDLPDTITADGGEAVFTPQPGHVFGDEPIQVSMPPITVAKSVVVNALAHTEPMAALTALVRIFGKADVDTVVSSLVDDPNYGLNARNWLAAATT